MKIQKIFKSTDLTQKQKIRNVAASAGISLLLLFIMSMADFSYNCNEIRTDVLRLHVIANSDSAEDQELKLKIRDKILEEGSELFDGSLNVKNAAGRIAPKTEELKKAAIETARENGFDYDVNIKIGQEFFTTREYENFTMPAGEYLSLIVKIGEGKGHNWWCVMFPPLCLPAAEENSESIYEDVFTDGETDIIEGQKKYKVKFKILEWYEQIKRNLS